MNGGRTRPARDGRIIWLQEVPARLREELLALQQRGHRMVPVLLACNDAGWSGRALAEALGRTNTGVERALCRARALGERPDAAGLNIPRPPRPSGVLEPQPPAAAIAHLRALQHEASGLRGGMAADDPRRIASAHFATDLQALVEADYSVAVLARELGVRDWALVQRLARYGFRDAPPSFGLPEVTTAVPLDGPCERIRRRLACAS